MLGFNAFSEQAISDISLPVITGVLYAVDSNDTAVLLGEVLVEGTINTTDGNDFALLSGAGTSTAGGTFAGSAGGQGGIVIWYSTATTGATGNMFFMFR